MSFLPHFIEPKNVIVFWFDIFFKMDWGLLVLIVLAFYHYITHISFDWGKLFAVLFCPECLKYSCEQTLFNAPGEALALTDAARLFLTSEKENWALQAPGFDEHLQAALNCYSFAIKVQQKLSLTKRSSDRVHFLLAFIQQLWNIVASKKTEMTMCLCVTGTRCTLRWTSQWWQPACVWNWETRWR